eukprot:scaffold6.g2875.t1
MAVYNVNVGVLGHVDSGKTSLVAALSTTLSTAALDKHPQSRERGITIDLGFSSFTVPAPDHIRAAGYGRVQFTLVDCPGHASLIRTIIGGAQIIDLMVLVVDVTKGIQPQTAECIVIGEVATGDMVVALNKTDLLPPEKRERYLKKAQKLVAQTLAATKFAGAPQVTVAARPAAPAPGDEGRQAAGAGALDSGAAAEPGAQGVDALTLLSRVRLRPGPAGADSFLFYIDHCFAIKGQGTVLTGTVVRGSVRVGDSLELPQLKQQRKVKSIQVFHQPVQSCGPGDRAGICVTQLNAKLLERGVACAPGSVPTFESAVAAVEKIRFYAGDVKSRAKMHVTVGPSTVMAELLVFGLPDGQGVPRATALDALVTRVGALGLQETAAAAAQQREAAASGSGRHGQRRAAQQAGAVGGGPGSASASQTQFDFQKEYLYQEELYGIEGRPPAAAALPGDSSGDGRAQDPGAELQQQPLQQPPQEQEPHYGPQWCYLRFSQPVTAPADSLVIGAKLDADLQGTACRLAFYGRLCAVPAAAPAAAGPGGAAPPAAQQQRQEHADPLQRQLRIYKARKGCLIKQREGSIERMEPDGCTAICRSMFQKETDLSLFAGEGCRSMEVAASGGARGRIEGGFGKSGKFRAYFPGGVAAQRGGAPTRLTLAFKRFLFDSDRRRMVQ